MSTSGLAAFDDATRATLLALAEKRRRPSDRFGDPIFCHSCTDRIGIGSNRSCPRWNSATSHICPFREVLHAHRETEEA